MTTKTYSLGDFDVLEVLGKGSFATVYRVRLRKSASAAPAEKEEEEQAAQPSSSSSASNSAGSSSADAATATTTATAAAPVEQTEYALKAIDKSLVVRRNKVKYVHVEKVVLSMARHPLIPRLLATFQSRDTLYFAMELCEGGDLRSLLSRTGGTIAPSLARFYAAELLVALDFLHSRGILHRDVKPENVLLTRDRHVKLTDFGCAKVVPCAQGAATVAPLPLEPMPPRLCSCSSCLPHIKREEAKIRRRNKAVLRRAKRSTEPLDSDSDSSSLDTISESENESESESDSASTGDESEIHPDYITPKEGTAAGPYCTSAGCTSTCAYKAMHNRMRALKAQNSTLHDMPPNPEQYTTSETGIDLAALRDDSSESRLVSLAPHMEAPLTISAELAKENLSLCDQKKLQELHKTRESACMAERAAERRAHPLVVLPAATAAASCLHATGARNSFVGTPEYMAPEMLEDRFGPDVGPPADLWALAILLYRMLCGTTPFVGDNDYMTFQRIQEGALVFRDPQLFSPPARLLIESMLRQDPAARATADEIRVHPFFDAFDFTNLWEQTPPALASNRPQRIPFMVPPSQNLATQKKLAAAAAAAAADAAAAVASASADDLAARTRSAAVAAISKRNSVTSNASSLRAKEQTVMSLPSVETQIDSLSPSSAVNQAGKGEQSGSKSDLEMQDVKASQKFAVRPISATPSSQPRSSAMSSDELALPRSAESSSSSLFRRSSLQKLQSVFSRFNILGSPKISTPSSQDSLPETPEWQVIPEINVSDSSSSGRPGRSQRAVVLRKASIYVPKTPPQASKSAQEFSSTKKPSYRSAQEAQMAWEVAKKRADDLALSIDMAARHQHHPRHQGPRPDTLRRGGYETGSSEESEFEDQCIGAETNVISDDVSCCSSCSACRANRVNDAIAEDELKLSFTPDDMKVHRFKKFSLSDLGLSLKRKLGLAPSEPVLDLYQADPEKRVVITPRSFRRRRRLPPLPPAFERALSELMAASNAVQSQSSNSSIVLPVMPWDKYLSVGECVIRAGVVDRRWLRYGRNHPRVLVLTDTPRLFMLDTDLKKFKGEIPFSFRLLPKLSNSKIFQLETGIGSNQLIFHCVYGDASEWYTSIVEQKVLFQGCTSNDGKPPPTPPLLRGEVGLGAPVVQYVPDIPTVKLSEINYVPSTAALAVVSQRNYTVETLRETTASAQADAAREARAEAVAAASAAHAVAPASVHTSSAVQYITSHVSSALRSFRR